MPVVGAADTDGIHGASGRLLALEEFIPLSINIPLKTITATTN